MGSQTKIGVMSCFHSMPLTGFVWCPFLCYIINIYMQYGCSDDQSDDISHPHTARLDTTLCLFCLHVPVGLLHIHSFVHDLFIHLASNSINGCWIL